MKSLTDDCRQRIASVGLGCNATKHLIPPQEQRLPLTTRVHKMANTDASSFLVWPDNSIRLHAAKPYLVSSRFVSNRFKTNLNFNKAAATSTEF